MLRTRRNQIPIISQAQDDPPWGLGNRVIPNAPDRGGGQQDDWGIGQRVIPNAPDRGGGQQDDWGIGQRVIPNAPDRGGGQQDDWGIGRRVIANAGSNGRRPHVPQAPAAAHWSAHRTTPEPRGHNRRRRSLQAAADGPEHFGAGLADLLGTAVSPTEHEAAARKQAAYIADLDAQVKARQLKKQHARAEDARHQREELQLEAQGGSAVAAAALERLGISALPVRQTVVVPQQPPTARNVQAEAAAPKHLLAGDYRVGYAGPIQLGRPTSASARPPSQQSTMQLNTARRHIDEDRGGSVTDRRGAAHHELVLVNQLVQDLAADKRRWEAALSKQALC